MNKYGLPSHLANGLINPDYLRNWHELHPDYNRKYQRHHRNQMNEMRRIHWKLYPEIHQERARVYYWKHRERRISYTLAWQKAHPEKVRAKWLRWTKNNPDKRKEMAHRDHKLHPKRLSAWRKAHPEKLRQQVARRNYKRRGLSANTVLGIYFPTSHFHHMTRDLGIYIPETLHKSIRHNIWTGEGMNEINWKAWIFHLKGFTL